MKSGSVDRCGWISLIATTRFKFGSFALYTADIPPCPSNALILYLPFRERPIQVGWSIALLFCNNDGITSIKLRHYTPGKETTLFHGIDERIDIPLVPPRRFHEFC